MKFVLLLIPKSSSQKQPKGGKNELYPATVVRKPSSFKAKLPAEGCMPLLKTMAQKSRKYRTVTNVRVCLQVDNLEILAYIGAYGNKFPDFESFTEPAIIWIEEIFGLVWPGVDGLHMARIDTP